VVISLVACKSATVRDTFRILLTRIDDWQAVSAVYGEFFRDIGPANTIMQVSRFIARNSRTSGAPPGLDRAICLATGPAG
jgi:hypothetical protein